jgi:hypothetical protein
MKLENEMSKALIGGELKKATLFDGYECDGFFFMETDVPVMTEPTILSPQGKNTGRKMWTVETVSVSGGSYWNPPDCDEVEVCDGKSLLDAIINLGYFLAREKVNNIAESICEQHLTTEEE